MTDSPIRRQKTKVFAIGLTSLAATAVLTFGTMTSAAENEPEPISVKQLTDRHEFTDRVAVQITLMVEGQPRQVVDLPDGSNLAVL